MDIMNKIDEYLNEASKPKFKKGQKVKIKAKGYKAGEIGKVVGWEEPVPGEWLIEVEFSNGGSFDYDENLLKAVK